MGPGLRRGDSGKMAGDKRVVPDVGVLRAADYITLDAHTSGKQMSLRQSALHQIM
jgi:hypothetical protein